MQLPSTTKELLDLLRNIQCEDPQELISIYTQSLCLLKDDIHSLFIFLDHINLILSHSELDEIEHLYTLFKVKLRKYRIFWINYLKFEVKNRNKAFDVSFGKIIEYLKYKSFEGKDEIMESLMQERESLKKEICNESREIAVDGTNEYKVNKDNGTTNDKIDSTLKKSADDSSQNISTNDLFSSNIFTDQSDIRSTSPICAFQKDIENKHNTLDSQCYKNVNTLDSQCYKNGNTAESENYNTAEPEGYHKESVFKKKINAEPTDIYDSKKLIESGCLTQKSISSTKTLMSTPSAIRTWSDTNKTYNVNTLEKNKDDDRYEKTDSVLSDLTHSSSKIKDSSGKINDSKIAFELEMNISQDTTKLRFSPNKRIPYRSDNEKSKFVDIMSTSKDTTRGISCDLVENTTVFSNNVSSITFKNKELLFISKIGKGGYSNVYRVSFDGELYALKQIRIEDQEGLNICMDEINLLRNLGNCDFVIRMIDYEIKNDVVNILFEYGETDLHKLIKSAQLNMFYIKYIWESILKILVFIHSQRIVHRDIKPANFVLVRGKLKIIDFGISKSIKGDTTSILNFEKAGTLNYISPEQCIGRKVSRSADIWAAGCILYYMIYKRNIYNASSVMDILRLMGDETEIFYGEGDPDAIETIKACLVYDPKRRAKPEDLLNYKFLKK